MKNHTFCNDRFSARITKSDNGCCKMRILERLFTANVYGLCLVILCLVNRCSSQCGSTFKNAWASGKYNGLSKDYIYNGCINNSYIEGFFLSTHTAKILKHTFYNLPNLFEIGFNDAAVRVIQPRFSEYTPHLKIFKAERDHIEIIEKDVFNTLNLEIIDLNSNRIHHIDDGAFGKMNLTYLCLSNNDLTKINSSWFQNTTIVALALVHNRISSLHANTFDGITELVTLKLDFNKIYYIHYDAFSKQCCLVHLYLSGNSLTSLHFQVTSTLKYVDASFNMITSTSLENPTALETISIYPNPWSCQCLLRFLKEIGKRNIEITQTDSLKVAWKDEFPICLAYFAECDGQNLLVRNLLFLKYFQLIDYNALGKFVYKRGDDFVDYGNGTMIWYNVIVP